jgi:membrane fusion protein, multidrug efflux system
VTIQPVTLGPTSDDRVVIQSGLSVGDKVVIDGADRLRNGAKVTLSDAAAAKSANGDVQPGGTNRGKGQPSRTGRN